MQKNYFIMTFKELEKYVKITSHYDRYLQIKLHQKNTGALRSPTLRLIRYYTAEYHYKLFQLYTALYDNYTLINAMYRFYYRYFMQYVFTFFR